MRTRHDLGTSVVGVSACREKMRAAGRMWARVAGKSREETLLKGASRKHGFRIYLAETPGAAREGLRSVPAR